MIDACDGAFWRTGLLNSQLRTFKAQLEEVLEVLACASEENQAASFEQAQDCLLDAILYHCSMSSPGWARWPSRYTAL
jgi:hypothetical protein